MAFNLSSISKAGTRKSPPVRMVIYGTAGVGKTTFATRKAGSIVLQTEDGLAAIRDVDAFPLARSYNDILQAIETLAAEMVPVFDSEGKAELDGNGQPVLVRNDHGYTNLVLDSADWAERLIEMQVAKDHGLKEFNLQAKELAYGRGNKAVGDKWRNILDGFDYLRNERGMSITIVAHSQVKRFDDPSTDAYDRYILDLNKESAAVVSEWSDMILFAGFRVTVKAEEVGIGTKKRRGLSDGSRYLYTQERPAWIAKSRWELPEAMELNREKFDALLAEAQAKA